MIRAFHSYVSGRNIGLASECEEATTPRERKGFLVKTGYLTLLTPYPSLLTVHDFKPSVDL